MSDFDRIKELAAATATYHAALQAAGMPEDAALGLTLAYQSQACFSRPGAEPAMPVTSLLSQVRRRAAALEIGIDTLCALVENAEADGTVVDTRDLQASTMLVSGLMESLSHGLDGNRGRDTV
ncbi:MAG: hypothetical protein KF785_09385 [Gemmatimonadales bacterium]|nr:hypothetical protein [Gemmatimonadales bacterium]